MAGRVYFRWLAVWFLLCCAWANGTSWVVPNYVFDSIHVNDFAVDDQCNLYLVGYKKGVGTDHGFAVEKYDRNGRKCWENIYEVLPEGFGYADSVALDGQGNVYVAGRVQVEVGKKRDGAAIFGVAIVKYSPDGQMLWDTVYKKPGYVLGLFGLKVLADSSVCVVIDTVTDSEVEPRPSSYSFRALIYDPSGKKVRENILGDFPVASAAIGASSVCVVESALLDLNDDVFSNEYSVVEFDEEGNRSVLKTLSSKTMITLGGLHRPETGALIPTMVTAGRQGNFYIAGICRLNSKSEVQTVTSMFSHSGNQLWKYVSRRSVDAEELESDWPDALVVDDAGSVYLADWFGDDVPESTVQEFVWPSVFRTKYVNRLRISKCNSRGVNEWTYEHKTDKKGVAFMEPVFLKVLDSGNISCISLVQGPGPKPVTTANLHVLALASNGKKIFDGLVSRPSDWPKIFIKR